MRIDGLAERYDIEDYSYLFHVVEAQYEFEI